MIQFEDEDCFSKLSKQEFTQTGFLRRKLLEQQR